MVGQPDIAPEYGQVAGSMPIWSFSADCTSCLQPKVSLAPHGKASARPLEFGRRQLLDTSFAGVFEDHLPDSFSVRPPPRPFCSCWLYETTCQRSDWPPVGRRRERYAQELCTYRLLTAHVRQQGRSAGYPELERLSRSKLRKILTKAELRPIRFAIT
jgi:hypothetical protein